MMNSLNSVSDGINSFGLNLYHQLSQDNENKPNNLFLSPYSIFIPLLMALEGANGETAQQMGSVLCLSENVNNTESLDSPWLTENVHPRVAELTQNLINLVAESSENNLVINNQIQELEENLKLIQKQSENYRHLSYEADNNYRKQRQIIREQCYENYNQVKAITEPKIKEKQAEIEQIKKNLESQKVIFYQQLYNLAYDPALFQDITEEHSPGLLRFKEQADRGREEDQRFLELTKKLVGEKQVNPQINIRSLGYFVGMITTFIDDKLQERLNERLKAPESFKQKAKELKDFNETFWTKQKSQQETIKMIEEEISLIEQPVKEIGQQSEELYQIRLQELQNQLNFQNLEYYRSYQEQLWQEENSTAEQLNLLYKQGMPVEIAIANSIWKEKKADFKPTFLETLNQFYGEVVHSVDFTKSEQVRLEINQWIENNTKHKIKDCLKPENIDPTTILVLINAIYFRGNWLHEFNPQNTHDRDFTQLEGTKIKIPFMDMREEKFNYGCFNIEQGEKSKFFQTRWDEQERVPQVQIIELPYRNEQFSMVILLPAAHDQLPFLESQLSYEKLNQWLAQLWPTSCNLLLPKFKIETRFSLEKYLSDLGMPRAFTANAQFQKMYDGEIKIDQLIHQTFLEVDEEGTKAAAVTVLMSEECLPHYEDFYADRPFLFFIRDRNTGLILFLGRFMGC